MKKKDKHILENKFNTMRTSLPHFVLWFIIRRKKLFGFFFFILLFFCILKVALNCSLLDIADFIKTYFHVIPTNFVDCMYGILSFTGSITWEIRTTILSVSFTVLTMTQTITSFVFDGKTIAGVKKETINNFADNNFLHNNKFYLFFYQLFIIISILFKYEIILLFSFVFLTILTAIQLQLCLCYSVGKQASIYTFSLNILLSISTSIKQLLEFDLSNKAKKGNTWSFPALADSICSPISSSVVADRAESQQLILYIVANVIAEKRDTKSVSAYVKKSLHKLMSDYDSSVVFYPMYVLFYNFFSKAMINKSFDSKSAFSFLKDAVFISIDTAVSNIQNRKHDGDTLSFAYTYHTRLAFYSIAGIFLGILDAGCPIYIIEELLKSMQRYLISIESKYVKEINKYNLCSNQWNLHFQGLSSIIILWNENQIRINNYLNDVISWNNKTKNTYYSNIRYLFDSIKLQPIATPYTEKRCATNLDKIEADVKSVLFWWLISSNSASMFAYLKSNHNSIYSKYTELLNIYKTIYKYQNNPEHILSIDTYIKNDLRLFSLDLISNE